MCESDVTVCVSTCKCVSVHGCVHACVSYDRVCGVRVYFRHSYYTA